MTRILQIRRGTSAQNDNFTGLNGEITMDTTNKTVRIHDGETLGGFALARHDEIDTEPFDINDVSADFWTALFATYQTHSVIHSESTTLLSVPSANFMDITFTCTQMPFRAEIVLVCQSPEAGYSIDDEVRAFGVGNHANPGINTYLSNGVLHGRFFLGGQAIWVPHKMDGTQTNITNNKWKLKMIVYY